MLITQSRLGFLNNLNRFICCGGGGLISGATIGAKGIKPEVEIIGCQPINGEVMWKSIEAGEIVDLEYEETLSDGSAGNLEPESVTFDLCQNKIPKWISVTEEEIASAVKLVAQQEKQIIEGAAGRSAHRSSHRT